MCHIFYVFEQKANDDSGKDGDNGDDDSNDGNDDDSNDNYLPSIINGPSQKRAKKLVPNFYKRIKGRFTLDWIWSILNETFLELSITLK